MAVLYTNNASSTLAATIDDEATSLTVATGEGARFPSPSGGDFFFLTITPSTGDTEIVKVTARSSDTMTIEREQDGTTAPAEWASGTVVELRATKGLLDQLKLDANGIHTPDVTSGNYTYTATKTYLHATPDSPGCTIKLPAGTSVLKGGPLHITDNNSPYDLRLVNANDKLLGFVPRRTAYPHYCADNSSVDAVWADCGMRLLAVTARVHTTAFAALSTVSPGGFGAIDMDGDIEVLVGYRGSDGYAVAMAHKRSTRQFGAVAVIRATNIGAATRVAAIKHTTTQLLVATCASSSTALEVVAVALNPSTLALTPDTPATYSMAANFDNFADGCGFMALPSLPNSFVLTYALNGLQSIFVHAISVSGSTPTIGTPANLTGQNPIVATTADKVMVTYSYETWINIPGYTVSGSTLSAGTALNLNTGSTVTINKFFPLGARWCVLYNTGGSTVKGGIVSLSGADPSLSSATLHSAGTLRDAVVVNGMVLTINNQSSNNANLLTDSSGTASAGTAASMYSAATEILGVGEDYATVFASADHVYHLDCSSASPTFKFIYRMSSSTAVTDPSGTSNAVLSTPAGIRRASGGRAIGIAATVGQPLTLQIDGDHAFHTEYPPGYFNYGTLYRGASNNDVWSIGDVSGQMVKLEMAA